MAVYKATRVGVKGLEITRSGQRVDGTPLFFTHEQELAEAFAKVMNIAFEAGKDAQKLETETPLLAALCA